MPRKSTCAEVTAHIMTFCSGMSVMGLMEACGNKEPNPHAIGYTATSTMITMLAAFGLHTAAECERRLERKNGLEPLLLKDKKQQFGYNSV